MGVTVVFINSFFLMNFWEDLWLSEGYCSKHYSMCQFEDLCLWTALFLADTSYLIGTGLFPSYVYTRFSKCCMFLLGLFWLLLSFYFTSTAYYFSLSILSIAYNFFDRFWMSSCIIPLRVSLSCGCKLSAQFNPRLILSESLNS